MAAFDEMRHGDEGMRSILREADFVVVSVPLTPATKRMIGATEVALPWTPVAASRPRQQLSSF